MGAKDDRATRRREQAKEDRRRSGWLVNCKNAGAGAYRPSSYKSNRITTSRYHSWACENDKYEIHVSNNFIDQ
jgi:hypothetical protein